MDVNLFLSDLAQSLGAGVFGPAGYQANNGLNFTPSLLQACMCIAVREYQRWRQPLRQYGSGVMYSQANVGATSLQLIGGPWIAGQTILVDSFLSQEALTIQSVGLGQPQQNWVGTPQTVTLTGPTTITHYAGANCQMQTPGMSIVCGINQYQLPSDFVLIDAKTFNYANGSQGGMIHKEAFYDNAYRFSQALSGVGFALNQTFFGSGGGSGFGYFAVPDSPVGAYFNPPVQTGIGFLFQYMSGNPPVFFATPTPNFDSVWSFNYRGQYTPETVPDYDFDALLDLAKAFAVESAQAIMAGSLDWKEDDVTESPSKNADALQSFAQAGRKIFEKKIRLRPYMVTG